VLYYNNYPLYRALTVFNDVYLHQLQLTLLLRAELDNLLPLLIRALHVGLSLLLFEKVLIGQVALQALDQVLGPATQEGVGGQSMRLQLL
jgi:hypothetical protein